MKNILLVDDKRMDREMVKSLLHNREGCHLLEAQNGLEALDMVSKKHPDLVLMDLYMPDMNGDECCDLMKQDDNSKDIPVIIITSDIKAEMRTQCIDAGCDDLISKPINRRDFLSKVNAFTGLPIRCHARKATEITAAFTCKGENYTGTIMNLSEGGAYIVSATELAAGNLIQMRFEIGTVEITHAVAQVAWTEEKGSPDSPDSRFGLGVKFIDIQEGAKELIADF